MKILHGARRCVYARIRSVRVNGIVAYDGRLAMRQISD